MKIIVDSGATKTAWRAICDDGSVREVQTAGLSPTCLDPEHVHQVVRAAMPELNPLGVRVEKIFFYGAGLVSSQASTPIADALDMWCPLSEMEFHSDILAAARALFGDGSGVVAIMGTGSNSCLYDNGRVVRNIRPGGFILGDEGSGTALGKAFISDFIKGLLPGNINDDFVARYSLDYNKIVQKVYKEPGASAFMASFAPFILEYSDDTYIKGMIEDCLESFVRRSLSRYSGATSAASDVGVVGSFGCACEEMLKTIGGRYGLEFVKFLKNPVDELVNYHSNGI